MENSQKLIDWSLRHKDDLKLRVDSFQWVNMYYPTLKDVAVSISINGKETVGRGTHVSESKAYLKALGEALERSVLIKNDIGSNGVALFTTKSGAKARAQYELLERDAFLRHFAFEQPFFALDWRSLLSREALDSILEFESRKVTINIAMMKVRQTGVTGVVCYADGLRANPPFGLSVGAGCSENIVESIESALMEVNRHLAQIIHAGADTLTLEKFLLKPKHTPEDHLALALDIEYAQKAKKILDRRSEAHFSDESNKASFSFSNITPSSGLLSEAPIFVYRSQSTELIDMFFGPTPPKTFCPYLGESFKPVDIPHPFG